MTHWSRDYLGLPYEPRGRTRTGLDCWGLVCLVYADRLGVILPSYSETGVSAEERHEAEALFKCELGAWRDVPPREEREFDVVWLREADDRLATHVGVVMRAGLMLHASAGANQVDRADYAAGAWSRLLIGCRRHEARP